jgi:hypothetical protein
MIIYLFRDIDADDIFAFSTDLTGTNIPPVTQTTDWLFQEALDLIEFANRTVGDFRNVLDRLKADGFYLCQASLIESPMWPHGHLKDISFIDWLLPKQEREPIFRYATPLSSSANTLDICALYDFIPRP